MVCTHYDLPWGRDCVDQTTVVMHQNGDANCMMSPENALLYNLQYATL